LTPRCGVHGQHKRLMALCQNKIEATIFLFYISSIAFDFKLVFMLNHIDKGKQG
jgi:hypothetical protein